MDQEKIEHLRTLAKEYHTTLEAKLRGVAKRLTLSVSAAEAREALSTNVAKQLLAPAVPHAQGKSAAEGLGSRYQADLIDFNLNTKHGPGQHKYALVLTDVFSRETWAKPMPTKDEAAVSSAFGEIKGGIARSLGKRRGLNGCRQGICGLGPGTARRLGPSRRDSAGLKQDRRCLFCHQGHQNAFGGSGH